MLSLFVEGVEGYIDGFANHLQTDWFGVLEKWRGALYNSGRQPSIIARAFESAEASVLEVKDIREGRKPADDLPDIAIVDLNFNKSMMELF
jgi:hypothetical protein